MLSLEYKQYLTPNVEQRNNQTTSSLRLIERWYNA